MRFKAVQEAPTTQDVIQLCAFLGLVNYYGRFLPDLAAILAPLYDLLQKNSCWKWDQEEETAFQKVKSLLSSDHVLVHYDEMKEIVMACDAHLMG